MDHEKGHDGSSSNGKQEDTVYSSHKHNICVPALPHTCHYCHCHTTWPLSKADTDRTGVLFCTPDTDKEQKVGQRHIMQTWHMQVLSWPHLTNQWEGCNLVYTFQTKITYWESWNLTKPLGMVRIRKYIEHFSFNLIKWGGYFGWHVSYLFTLGNALHPGLGDTKVHSASCLYPKIGWQKPGSTMSVTIDTAPPFTAGHRFFWSFQQWKCVKF